MVMLYDECGVVGCGMPCLVYLGLDLKFRLTDYSNCYVIRQV